jgi:benzoylformate decarboxylase
VAHRAPVTFLILRNDEDMSLNWFSALEEVAEAPGLDLPGLDTAAVATGYGVPFRDMSGREELVEALLEAIAADDGPRLVQARAAGMWLE